ncbi:MAG: carboxypeptidase-like regulatory domain-containing protein [Saprospiraceae bacterium]|nr:carboxypeptidase-like regulatory domain-containing protein [Saprospiraceae bacterium]
MTKQRFWLWLAFMLVSAIHISAQGTVRGKISDENGEPLIGVSVFLKDNATVGTSTDLDGIYSLQISSDIAKTIVVSYISYETIEVIVQVAKGEVLIKDFIMGAASFTLGEVEIVAKQERNNQYYMESIKKKSASTLDYMSGDQMNKIGDNNVSAAIARVTGVATNGNFITVRGLGDRYVQTCVNGSLIPTLDPFTNNIQLDLFPSSFVDNIIITKTASADIQGDWAAAYISIETKDNPDKFSLGFETKVGYAPQTSLKKIITNQTSPTDWLGYDNGFRDINHDQYTPVNPSPTQYEQFCALGLEDYFRSIGITESWFPGSEIGETYFRLGLVELGLLGPAFINDAQAVNGAKEEYYSGTYQDDAFKVLNADAEESLDAFANNWDTFEETAPLNFSQTFSIGNQTKLFNKPFSFLGGFRYANGVQYDPHAYFNRAFSTEVDSSGNPFIIQQYNQEYANYSSGWTALATINYKLNSNNSFSLLFMQNLIGVNQIRDGVDRLGSTIYPYAFLQQQFYEERSQYTYQYQSDHYSEASGLRWHLSASFADGESTAPDFKSLEYFSEDEITYQIDETLSNVRRNFRYLNEDILDTKATVELPLLERPGYISKLKFGAGYLDKQREFLQYDYRLSFGNSVTRSFQNGQLNEFFADENFDIQINSITGDEQINMFYRQFDDPGFHTIGYSKVYSGFAMIDESITEKIRISGGLRAEYSDLFTDVKVFDELGYAADDLRRLTPQQSFVLTPTNFDRWDFLPSVNFIYRLRNDEISPSNLRLNYSRTIARPSIREYTETVIRDFELNADVFGNAELKFVEISNYDVRYENYFQAGNYISASLFYKDFRNHIELTSSNIGFTWSNAEKSNVYGIELEGRIKLPAHLELSANVSLVNSYTEVEDRRLRIENGIKSWDVVGMIERNMFGQAPYVVNTILNYLSDKGLSASLSYNIQGPKLVLTSADASPDVYEMPRHLLNFKIAHPLGKHFNVSFTIKDILNQPVRRAYEYEEGYLLDFDYYRFGTEYTIGVAYNL